MSARLRPSILARLQRGLEQLYRVETQLDVEAFIIAEERRQEEAARAGVARTPREQLLVRQSHEELELGLFVDQEALQNLEDNDPAAGLTEGNFGDFCLVVEGVSHFVYVAVCAAGDRTVSALELELQAEVDKFVCCLLADPEQRPAPAPELRRRLYHQMRLAEDLDGAERDRYRTANDQAHRYSAVLDRRFLACGRLPEMLEELRRFYRLGLEDKLGRIARLAA